MFEVRYHRTEFVAAQEGFEYERAKDHRLKMEEIVQRQNGRRRSEEQKLSSTVLVLESVAQCRLEFEMQVGVRERFGESMGKAIILSSGKMRKGKG